MECAVRAKRSGALVEVFRSNNQSGVALRLPPRSKVNP